MKATKYRRLLWAQSAPFSPSFPFFFLFFASVPAPRDLVDSGGLKSHAKDLVVEQCLTIFFFPFFFFFSRRHEGESFPRHSTARFDRGYWVADGLSLLPSFLSPAILGRCGSASFLGCFPPFVETRYNHVELHASARPFFPPPLSFFFFFPPRPQIGNSRPPTCTRERDLIFCAAPERRGEPPPPPSLSFLFHIQSARSPKAPSSPLAARTSEAWRQAPNAPAPFPLSLFFFPSFSPFQATLARLFRGVSPQLREGSFPCDTGVLTRRHRAYP